MRTPTREYTLENLRVYAEWVADKFRQEELGSDGWSEGGMHEYYLDPDWDYSDISQVANLTKVELLCRWGLEEEGYRQEWYEHLVYDTEQEWLEEYDKNFPAVKGIKLVYSSNEPEKEYSVFGTKI
tara:strand:- start:1374 stop:1751 length:378 start_codon:yes stop_codon:yes gene_type:complete